MIRKRINTDLFLRFSVVMKDGSPANFTGAENMRVVIWHSLYSNIRLEQAFKVEGNMISLQFSSEENQKTGRYGVSIFWSKQDPESETGRREYAVDFPEAFTVVPYSNQEDDGTIEYTGKVNQNPDGIAGSGTVDLSDYYNKKEVDDKLKKKVDSVSGKGLSTCDYTQDEKDKLSGLSNYDDSELQKQVAEKANKISVYTRQEVDAKILASASLITTDEQEVGMLRYAGKDYTIYELTAELSGLPTAVGQSVDVILSGSPLGNNLYLKVDCLSVSSGDSFPVSAFEVKKIFVDEQSNTVATIICKEAVTGEAKALLTIRYVKGLLSFDTFELSIPVSELGITTVDEVMVRMPSLKYDKKFAFSWTTDDALLCVYSLMHKYINKKYIDDEYNYHDGMTPTTGMTPTRVLCSTDGCGNDVRFRLDSGWVSYSGKMSDEIHGDSWPYVYIRWSELVTFLDFFNTAMNHGGGDQTKPVESIEMCGNRLFEKTGYFPFLLLVPGGTTGYREVAETLDYIYHVHQKNNLNYSTDSITKDSFKLKTGLLARRTYDTLTFEQLCDHVNKEATREDHPYIYLGGHRVSDGGGQIEWTTAVKPFLDYLHDTYGKGGNDMMWFAGPEEVYEYLFTRVFSIINTSVVDGNLIIDAKIAKLPFFKKFEYSLMLSKTDSFEAVPTITVDRPVTKISAAVREQNNILVNVNYNHNIKNLAEKYTAKYEASGAETDREDGLYFAGMLSDELAAPFLDRLGQTATGPVLNSINLNSGATSTYDQAITVGFNVTGAITHYKIGEAADLSSLAWIEGNAKAQNYTLSSGLGSKTVYARVKNAVGESDVKSATIELVERPAVTYTVTGAVNNAAYGTITPATQSVAEGGTANLTARANDGYVIDSWNGATTSSGVGLADGGATVSNVRANQTVTCNFRAASTPPAGNIKMRLSFGEPYSSDTFDEPSGINRVQSSTSTKNLLDTNGDAFGTVKALLAKVSTNIYGKKTGDDSGIVPDFVAEKAAYTYLSRDQATKSTIDYLFTVPNGRYKMGIMGNVDSSCPWAGDIVTDISKAAVTVNGISITITAMLDNTSVIDYSEEFEVIDGQITVQCECLQPGKRTGFTYIELEKV